MYLKLRLFVIASLLLCVAVTGYTQIPNPGFENWTANNPDGWFTSYIVYKNVVRCDTAHSGSYSAKGMVVSSITGVVGEFLNPGAYGAGCPVPAGLQAFSGYYQFHTEGGDQFQISMGVLKGHTETSIGNPIGAGIVTISSGAATWTKFTVPITYPYEGPPNWATVQFQIIPPAAGGPLHVGTYFLVDDLTLDEATGVSTNDASSPKAFSLNNNYPNPFNPSTKIGFHIPVESHVTLEILNPLGQRVALLEDNNLAAGSYERAWSADLASGVYFYRLQAVGVNDSRIRFTEMKKMVLMK